VLAIDTGRVTEAHLGQSAGPVHLVVPAVRGIDQIVHVGANEHLSELHKVTVGLVVDDHNAPRVLAGADLLVANLDHLVAANDCEGHLCLEIFMLAQS